MRAVLFTSLLLCLPSAADEGRQQDYAPGARAASLGGAFGALADDGTGVFYNPAGLVDVRTPRVNIATSLYGLELTGSSPVDNALFRGAVTPADLIFVPSSTGWVSGFGESLPSGVHKNAIAFSTMVPQYSSHFTEDLPGASTGTRFRSAVTDRRLHMGAAFAHRFGPWLRLGIAGHYVLRTLDAEESLVAADLGVPGAFIDASTRLRTSNHGGRVAMGAKLWLGPRTTLGVTLTTPAVSVWRDVSFERVVSSSDGSGDARIDIDRVRNGGLELQSDLPGSARIGFAFVQPGSFTFTSDLIAYLPVRYDVVSPALLGTVVVSRVPIPLRVEHGPLVNGAMGVDFFIADNLSMALGAFTNFTAAPNLAVDEDGALLPESSRLSRVQMFGGSISFGWNGKFNTTRAGLTGSGGFGQIVQPAAPDARFLEDGPPLRAVDASQAFIYFFWSSTFRFGEEAYARDYSL